MAIIEKDELVNTLRRFFTQLNQLEKNPTDGDILPCPLRSVHLSKKEMQTVLGCTAKQLENWIDEFQKNVDSLERNTSGHYLFDREQAPFFLEKAGIKPLEQIRKERDDYVVPITIVNTSKGGIAKTTTAITLAVASALDIKRSPRTLIIDGDPQGSVIKNISQVSLEYTFDSFLPLIKKGAKLSREERLSESVQSEFREALMDLIRPSFVDNLWVLPSNYDNSKIEMEIIDAMRNFDVDNGMNLFKDVIITPILDHFDRIVIDTSPSTLATTAAIYFASNNAIFPTTGRSQDYKSFITHFDLLADWIERYAPSDFKGLYDINALITRNIVNSSVLSKKIEHNVLKAIRGCSVFRATITENRKYEEATNASVPLLVFDSPNDDPYKLAMKEISSLYDEYCLSLSTFEFQEL